MKIAGYATLAVALFWAWTLTSAGDVDARAAAPACALLGIGTGLLTAAATREGTIRGASRRIRRDEHPASFRVAVAARAVASALLVIGAVVMYLR